MKKLLTVFGLLALAHAGFAFWVPTPLEQLAAFSHYVLVGKVTAVVVDTNTERLTVTMNVLGSLKGDATVGQDVVFEAPWSLIADVFISVPDFQFTPVTTNVLDGRTLVEYKTIEKPRKLRNSGPSFATNQVCAVFLRKPALDSPRILLTNETDGKLHVDWEKKLWRHAIMTDEKWKPLAELKSKVDAKGQLMPYWFPVPAVSAVQRNRPAPLARPADGSPR
jgi:hypothetical protein